MLRRSRGISPLKPLLSKLEILHPPDVSSGGCIYLGWDGSTRAHGFRPPNMSDALWRFTPLLGLDGVCTYGSPELIIQTRRLCCLGEMLREKVHSTLNPVHLFPEGVILLTVLVVSLATLADNTSTSIYLRSLSLHRRHSCRTSR